MKIGTVIRNESSFLRKMHVHDTFSCVTVGEDGNEDFIGVLGPYCITGFRGSFADDIRRVSYFLCESGEEGSIQIKALFDKIGRTYVLKHEGDHPNTNKQAGMFPELL